MNINFPLVLFLLVVMSGSIWLIDVLFFAKARRAKGQKSHVIVEYARSFFPILLIVFVFRSFLYQPFRVPTGSLEPTIEPGDFILVNMFDYGLRLPIIHDKIVNIDNPKKGNIMLFRWPVNPSVNFVKRVIGVPGDRIDYINKTLFINGKRVAQKYLGTSTDVIENGVVSKVKIYEEDLNGVKHKIYVRPNVPIHNYRNILVPPNSYFVMGDNRDVSEDSRYWGFVPNQNIIGKALFVWLSWDKESHSIRWNRIGDKL